MNFRLLSAAALLALAVAACSDDDEPSDEMLPCVVEGGTITGGPYTFTIDQIPDTISGVEVTGAVGPKTSYVVTDDAGTILAIFDRQGDLESNDFDAAGAGTCLIYNVSYQTGIRGLTRGSNIDELDGCFAVSNAIEVTRNACPAVGGTLSGGPYAFSRDGEPDNIPTAEVVLEGEEGESGTFVVTDPAGIIIALAADRAALGMIDFDTVGVDTNLLWYASINGELAGAEPGADATALIGCYALSNPDTIFRRCLAEGGELTGGPFAIEIDAEPDFLDLSGVTLTGAEGDSCTVARVVIVY